MSNVIIINDFNFKSNQTYFLDNNIWISLYAPFINTNIKQQKEASNFLKNIISLNSEIVVNSLVLSEFANTFLRFGFEQWRKKTHNPTANYKRDYKRTGDFIDTLNDVKDMIKSILTLECVSKYPDNFNSINLENILKNFEIDYNDAYYFQQCLDKDWILVTSDNDFDNLSENLTIIKI